MSIHMIHAGPRATKRLIASPCHPRPITALSRQGQNLMEAVQALFARNHCKGGMIDLAGLTFEGEDGALPVRLQKGEGCARPLPSFGPQKVISGTASFGWRYGVPFLHGHMQWQSPKGEMCTGQLRPHKALLAQDHILSALGTVDAWFEALPDAETGCTLFTPQGAESGRGIMARLLPGEDLLPALEAIAKRYALPDARLYGLGDLDRATLASGQRLSGTTEVHLAPSHLRQGLAEVSLHALDLGGASQIVPLAPRGNPIAMTFEVLLAPAAPAIHWN